MDIFLFYIFANMPHDLA